MVRKIAKLALLAAVAFAFGYMTISIVDRDVPQPRFGLLVTFASVLFFAILQTAFGGPVEIGPKPTRFPHEEEPLLGCPTCHSPMHLLGANVRQGRSSLYLWTCERDHGWSRQGESPADETYPWQACNPAEMMGVFFG